MKELYAQVTVPSNEITLQASPNHLLIPFIPPPSLGGNQRELARQKNAKKQQQKSKGASDKAGNKGTGLEQRKHRYHLT